MHCRSAKELSLMSFVLDTKGEGKTKSGGGGGVWDGYGWSVNARLFYRS